MLCTVLASRLRSWLCRRLSPQVKFPAGGQQLPEAGPSLVKAGASPAAGSTVIPTAGAVGATAAVASGAETGAGDGTCAAAMDATEVVITANAPVALGVCASALPVLEAWQACTIMLVLTLPIRKNRCLKILLVVNRGPLSRGASRDTVLRFCSDFWLQHQACRRLDPNASSRAAGSFGARPVDVKT